MAFRLISPDPTTLAETLTHHIQALCSRSVPLFLAESQQSVFLQSRASFCPFHKAQRIPEEVNTTECQQSSVNSCILGRIFRGCT